MSLLNLSWRHNSVPGRCRTLVAHAESVWIWPGIPLTLWHGAEIVPASPETIRFWVTRLHGPEALDRDILHAVASASRWLTMRENAKAQKALDRLGLMALSHDGALLMRAVADHLAIEPLELPLRPGLRTWNPQDIAIHLPAFKRQMEIAWPLMKASIPFDPSKHPRWPAGAPDSQGGEFAPADNGNSPIIDVQYRGYFHDKVVDYLVDLQRRGGGIAIKSVPLTTVNGITCIADALMKPPGKPVFILEVKTGNDPTYTLSQMICYPYAVLGNHVTSVKPSVTELGLVPGIPFPSMELVVMRTRGPSEPFIGKVIKPENLNSFLKKLFKSEFDW